MRTVPESTYTTEYFEHDCGGYEEWNRSHGNELPTRLKTALEVASVTEDMKVLDWGSGRGELSYQMAKLGARVTGVDYANAAIALSKKLPKHNVGTLTFRKIDSLQLSDPDNTYDRILFIDVIEHLYQYEVDELFKEFYRLLKPGGKVIIHTFPNRDHYDYGYPYFTRWANMFINLIWRKIFGEKLRSERSPRFGYDKKVHVNECNLNDVKSSLVKARLAPKVWYDSKFRLKRKRDYLRYYLLQPMWLSARFFSDDIWAIGTK